MWNRKRLKLRFDLISDVPCLKKRGEDAQFKAAYITVIVRQRLTPLLQTWLGNKGIHAWVLSFKFMPVIF